MAQEIVDGILPLLQGIFGEEGGRAGALAQVLKAVLEAAMKAEVSAHLEAGRYERAAGRKGHRNGYKPRTLKTRVGELELSVPQVRGSGGGPYHPSMFNRYQRSERALLVACAEMYFQGVSTARVQEVLGAMCGMEISAMTVSRVAAELDEKLADFRSRRLGCCPYVVIDARYEKVRREGGKVVSMAALVAVGYTSEGRREVLDVRVGDSESEATWGDLFRDLRDRGLCGVELVVSDAHRGIRSALARHFQGVAWQRCRVHFKRELAAKVSYKRRAELMRDAAAVFAPAERQECLRRAAEAALKWEGTCAAVAAMFREGCEDCLSVLALPPTHRTRLSSTNLLESLMRVIKRRTAVVGIFPNVASCERLVGAVLLEKHEEWTCEAQAWFDMKAAAAAAPQRDGAAAAPLDRGGSKTSNGL